MATKLHDAGFQQIELMKKLGQDGKGEHVFGVIGRAPGSEANEPASWGADALLVDGWDGVVWTPEQVPDNLSGQGDLESIGLLPNPPLPVATP